MSRFNAGRYIVTETAISAAINAVLNVAPAALSASGSGAVLIPSTLSLTFNALLPLFMGAFMSALVPSLLTRRRQLAGKLQLPRGSDGLTVIQVAFLSLLVAVSFTALGTVLAGTVLPLLAGTSLTLGAMLLFKGAYGGLFAASVTTLALCLLFGHGWKGNHG